ncbi:hypothetical protein EMPS_11418 [Entomortierella parvispora]|uniref:Helicase ATP-binding domain-containing protein n=1 Tax=Entomortierella parvispora TaxID=205924 RepID=A0A9P3M242_9FUNG|nr:hypothetical protein EMPS_11418 [Entomortierella parvispora]
MDQLEEFGLEIVADIVDPRIVLRPISSFEDLNLKDGLMQGIRDCRSENLSKLQQHVLPLIMLQKSPQNVLVDSRSIGAYNSIVTYSVPALNSIDSTISDTQVLVLVFSRELSWNVRSCIMDYAKNMPEVTFAPRMIDVAPREKVQGHVMVSTPGKLALMIRRQMVDVTNVKMVVIDRMDEMLDMGGLEDLILSLKRYLPEEIQILMFTEYCSTRVQEFSRRMTGDNVDMIRAKSMSST